MLRGARCILDGLGSQLDRHQALPCTKQILRLTAGRVNEPFPVTLLVRLLNLVESLGPFELMSADVTLLPFRIKLSAQEFPGFATASLKTKLWLRPFTSCAESVCLFILGG